MASSSQLAAIFLITPWSSSGRPAAQQFAALVCQSLQDPKGKWQLDQSVSRPEELCLRGKLRLG